MYIFAWIACVHGRRPQNITVNNNVYKLYLKSKIIKPEPRMITYNNIILALFCRLVNRIPRFTIIKWQFLVKISRQIPKFWQKFCQNLQIHHNFKKATLIFSGQLLPYRFNLRYLLTPFAPSLLRESQRWNKHSEYLRFLPKRQSASLPWRPVQGR